MSVHHHLNPGLGERTRAKMLTVDPKTRRIEGVLKDGSMIHIAVWDVPHAFRWPKENEVWIVRRDGGYWMLDRRVQQGQVSGDVNAVVLPEPAPLEELNQGDMKLDAEKVVNSNGHSMVAVDLTGVQSGSPLSWSPTADQFVAGPRSSSQQGASYTFVLLDAFTIVESTAASGVVLTVPTHATVAFAVNTTIEVFQYGTGQVTITAAGGVTLSSPGSLVHTAARYATITLRQRAINAWALSGDLS